MKKKPEQKQGDRPFFIEVPKPVNQMTQVEKDAFVAEILEAIDGQRIWKAAQCVNLKQEYERSFMVCRTGQSMMICMQSVAVVFQIMIQVSNA